MVITVQSAHIFILYAKHLTNTISSNSNIVERLHCINLIFLCCCCCYYQTHKYQHGLYFALLSSPCMLVINQRCACHRCLYCYTVSTFVFESMHTNQFKCPISLSFFFSYKSNVESYFALLSSLFLIFSAFFSVLILLYVLCIVCV